MPEVLNARDMHWDWKHQPNAVYVGRPTMWGNPFVIGQDGTREEVVEKYKRWLSDDVVERVKKDLAGKDLICWCAPLPCHADVLLELANQEETNVRNT